jgi:6-phosphogluconolactonase
VAIGEDGSFLGVLDTWAAEGEPAVGAGQTPVSVDVKDGNFPGQRSPARLVRGRTTQPHAVEIHQSNRFVFVADLQQNRLHVLRFDPGTGSFGWCQSLAVGDQAGGPRDVRMRPGGHTLYCANSNATVTVCDFDPGSGQLSEVQTVTVDRGEIRGGRKGGFQSIVLHPRLPVLYGVSRAPGVITSFAVAEDGRLSVRATDDLGCVHSRCLAISPDSRLLVAVGTYDSTLIPFGIEPEYGHLQRLAPVVSSPTPASIVFCYAGPTLVLAMLNRKSAGQRAGGSTRRSVSGAGF